MVVLDELTDGCRESKAAAEVLRGMLLPSPWTREVESQRQGWVLPKAFELG